MSSLSPLADIEDRVDGVSYHHDTDAENEFMQTAPTLSPLLMKHKLTNPSDKENMSFPDSNSKLSLAKSFSPMKALASPAVVVSAKSPSRTPLRNLSQQAPVIVVTAAQSHVDHTSPQRNMSVDSALIDSVCLSPEGSSHMQSNASPALPNAPRSTPAGGVTMSAASSPFAASLSAALAAVAPAVTPTKMESQLFASPSMTTSMFAASHDSPMCARTPFTSPACPDGAVAASLATNIDSTPSFESLAARLGSEANHDADMMDTASVKVAASPASARKTRLSIGGLLNSASPAARRASLSALMAAADAAAAKLSMSTSALSVTSGSAALAGLSTLSSRDQHLLLSELQIDVEADLEGLDLACASCTDLRTELGRVQDQCSAAHAELTANQNELALCVAELNAVREALADKEIALGASEAELINFREDTNAYNEKCKQIQDEGRMLYEQYEVKCVRVKELNKKIGALKEMCETLEDENNTLRSKCEEYAAAYEQENSRIIELTTDLEAARVEAASATMKAKHAKQATTNIDQRRRSKMPLNEDDENDSSAAELALRAEVEHWQQAHAQAQDGAAELRRVCDEWTAKANALQVEVASLKQATQHSYQTPRTPKSMSASSTPLRTPNTPVVQKQLTNQLNALQAQHESVLEELYTEREKCAQLDYQCSQLEAAAGGIQLQLHIYAPSDAAEVEAEANKAIEAAQLSASESIAALQHKLEQTQAELVTARTQQANAARAAQAIVASGSSNGGEIESLMISNELLRDEVAALQEAKQQNVMLQARAQAADGYALMINKLRAELAESKEETQRVLEDKDAELNMKDEEFKINDTAHCQVEEKLNEHIAAAEQELGFAQEQHDKLVAELEQTRAQHTMDLDAQETRLQGEISKLHDKLNEAAAQSESQRKSIKELQEMLILQKKRYAEEHAELTAKLASNDLSGKLAAAQQSCLLMQQQVEVSTKQLDQAAAVEQPLVAQVTAEIEAVWTALQEQSTLLQQQQEQQRASARQAAALVEQTQAECSRLETERQAAEFAASEARGRNTELEASLAAMSCDLSMWQKRTEAITEEREDLQMRLNAANEHADELMSQCNKLDSELQVMRDAFDMSTARGQAAESDNAALQERIAAAEQSIASLRAELSSTQNALTEEQHKCTSLSAELEEVQADREHIQQLHAGECDAHAETQSALEDAQRSGDATMAQLQRAQAQITELEGVCAELKQQLSESQSEASAQRTRAEEAEQACEAQVMLVDRVKGERDEARSSAEMDRQVAEEMQACMQADLDHALADARDLSTRLSEETTLLQAARTACDCEKAEKERALEQNLAECVRNEETNQLLTECTEQLTALRAEHMTLQEDSKNAAEAAAQLQEQLNADNAALSDALVRANEVSASLQHVLDETNAELHAATESLSVARAEASDLNELRTTLEADLAAVRADLSHTRTKLKVTAETCASVQVERDEALAHLADQEAAKRSLKESADSRHDAAQRTIERLEDSVRELREECAGLEGQLTASEQARKKLLHECGNLGVVRADAADAVVALERAQRAAAVAEERHARALKEVQERAAAEVQSMSTALTECKAAAERELRAAHQEQTRLHAALVREQDEHAATLERTPTICVDHSVAVSGSTASVGEQAELSLLRQEVAALRVSTRRSESELAAAQEALAEAKERLRAEVKALNATVFVAQKERDDAMKAKTKAAAEVEQLRAKYEAKKAEDAHLRNKVYTWAMTRLKSIHFVTDAEAAAGTPINDAASVSVEELVKLCVGYLKAGAPEVGDIPRVQAKIDRVVHQCAEREKQQKAAAPAPAPAPAPVQAPVEAEPVKMAVVKMVLPSTSTAGTAAPAAAAPLKRVSLLPSASAPIKFNLSALDSVPETSTAAPVAVQAAAAPSAASRRMSMSMQSAMERRQSLAGALANLHANNQQ